LLNRISLTMWYGKQRNQKLFRLCSNTKHNRIWKKEILNAIFRLLDFYLLVARFTAFMNENKYERDETSPVEWIELYQPPISACNQNDSLDDKWIANFNCLRLMIQNWFDMKKKSCSRCSDIYAMISIEYIDGNYLQTVAEWWFAWFQRKKRK